jgi:Flp pilus assembly protein TadG
METKQQERGQIVVLVVLTFVVLLGFTALTVDGGLIFWTRRRAQNAVDTGTMAAALAKIRDENWYDAGMNQAANYGFQNDSRNEVTIFNPPRSGVYAPPAANSDYYIQMVITATLDTAFAHFVYDGMLQTTVEAVAAMFPPNNIFAGNALVATNQTACQAVLFAGNGTTLIEGGDIFSNSDASGTPTSCHSGVASGSSADITVSGGGIYVGGTFRNQAGATINTDEGINEGASPPYERVVPLPDCSGLTTRTYHGGSGTLQPGYYPDGIRVNSSSTDLEMAPGMYCMGDDVTINGGSIHGDGIMIYMESGDFDISGNTEVHLRTSTNLTDASDYQWAGMFLYVDPANTGQVHISGSSGSSYTGTIYAPGPTQNPQAQHKCVIEGNGDNLGLNSQVICNTIKVTGDSYLYIHYNEEENFQLPPTVELME